MNKPKETDLYLPVKSFLEGQGYEVKGEIGAVDVMGMRDGDDPVIIELKTGFSLSLFHQGVERLAVCDDVYICVPRGKGKAFGAALKRNLALCRRLRLGLLSVRLRDGFVEAHCDPVAYRPVKSKVRRGRLLREFQRRVGDPNTGGQTRVGLVTAYRQDAILCGGFLLEHGASKGAIVAAGTGVARATSIMAADHYGWFERVSLGVYTVTPKGRAGLEVYSASSGVARENSDGHGGQS